MDEQKEEHVFTTQNPVSSKPNFMIPVSIVLSGVLVALAVIYSGASAPRLPAGAAGAVEVSGNADGMRAVSEAEDHILGNPAAPVKLIEYSDLECPFCKKFHHEALAQVINEYVKQGTVAIVYRHLPLDGLHSQARKEAEATECANELGGNAAFWAYVDRIFKETPSNDGLDLALLPTFAADLGMDRGRFSECLQSGRHADRVTRDQRDATAAGAQGTPYSVVLAPDGTKAIVSGAQPYTAVKKAIEDALARK